MAGKKGQMSGHRQADRDHRGWEYLIFGSRNSSYGPAGLGQHQPVGFKQMGTGPLHKHPASIHHNPDVCSVASTQEMLNELQARGRQKVITRMENTIWKCWMQPRPRLRVEKYTSLILVITAPAFHRGVTIPLLIGWETIVLHPYCMEQPPDNSPWITLKNGFSPYKGFPLGFKGVLFFKVFSFPTLQMGYEAVLNCITTTTQLPTSVSGLWIQNK